MRVIRSVFSAFLLLLLGPLLLFAALMLHTETRIPIPSDAEPVALERLVYKSRRFEAAVTSVRLEQVSAEGADPLIARWVFTGSNNDGQVHRLEMQIRLLDDTGKQISWFVAKHPLAAGAREQVFSVPMKVKADLWKKAAKVRIFADWIT
ncbi:MAG: hypothetical protein H7X85_03730 [Thermoanaerobaculia bacterium]|nr:hypothetical protein [Thermoanaerobaculia bacterium]